MDIIRISVLAKYLMSSYLKKFYVSALLICISLLTVAVNISFFPSGFFHLSNQDTMMFKCVISFCEHNPQLVSCLMQATWRRGVVGSTPSGTRAMPRSTSPSLRQCRSTSRLRGPRSSSTSTSSSVSSLSVCGMSSRTSTTPVSSVSILYSIVL